MRASTLPNGGAIVGEQGEGRCLTEDEVAGSSMNEDFGNNALATKAFAATHTLPSKCRIGPSQKLLAPYKRATRWGVAKW